MFRTALAVIMTLFIVGSPSAGYDTYHRLIKNLTPNSLTTKTDEGPIQIDANAHQTENIIRWIDGIVTTKKGRETFQAIIESGNTLTIKHSIHARMSAGRAIAPLTRNLTNGKGENVTIIMDADMLDSGTHKVYDRYVNLINFNALQNFYHELAHAMHKMQGTWRYFDSEGQAIEEENVFRQQLAQANKEVAELRYGEAGIAIDMISISKQ